MTQQPTESGSPERKPSGIPLSVLPPLRFCKFALEGFQGTKVAVLFPDTLKFDAKLAKHIFAMLKEKMPNLLIESNETMYHPCNLLTDKELESPGLKTLRRWCVVDGMSREVAAATLRYCLMFKLKAIVSAIIAAAEQTASATFHTESSCFEILASDVVRSGGGAVKSIAAFHANDGTFMDPDTHKIIEALNEHAVPFDEANIAAFVDPIELDGKFLLKNNSLADAFHGHGNRCEKTQSFLPAEERQSFTKFTWPEADIFFVAHKLDGTTPDVETREKDHQNHCETNTNLDVIPNRLVIAPLGVVFMNGRSKASREFIMRVFECATPAVIINHTGGHANVMSQLLKLLVDVLSDDVKALAQLVSSSHIHKVQKSLRIEVRLNLISPVIMLNVALQAACADESMPNQIRTSDVSQFLDWARARPKVFIETIKVVDPVLDSPENCLERLSGCFSSTYTGAAELGASAAQHDVVLEAWRIHEELCRKATDLKMKSWQLVYLAAFLTWLAVVLAILLQKFEVCNDLGGNFCEVFEIASTPGIERGREPWRRSAWYRILLGAVILVPVTSGLFHTIASRWMFREKWAAVHQACGAIVKEIHLFRGNCGEYSSTGLITHDSSDEDETQEEEVSQATKIKLARMRFVKQLSTISTVASLELKGDYLRMSGTEKLSHASVPQHVLQTVYEETSTHRGLCARLLSCLWFICSRGDHNASASASAYASPSHINGPTEPLKVPLISKAGGPSPVAAKAGGSSSLSPVPRKDKHSDGETMGPPSNDSLLVLAQQDDPEEEEEPDEVFDDCHSALTAETYFNCRTRKLLVQYREIVPRLAFEQDSGDLMLFVCSFVGSLLGAFHDSLWIPVVLGFAGLLSTIINYNGSRSRLIAISHALAGLHDLEVQWSALGNVDRRTPHFKEFLMQTTENLAHSVVTATVGTAQHAMVAGKDAGSAAKEKGGKKSKPKSKNKA